MATVQLSSAFGTASVTTTAGMLLDAAFSIDDRIVRPLARAPWLDQPPIPGLDGHLRVLAGEFVGVPFGSAGAPDQPIPGWDVPAQAPSPGHGRSADAEWQIAATTEDSVTLVLDYAEPSPVARLERTVALRADSPALDFTLVVTPRRAGSVALGLHPIVRLPENPGHLEVHVDFERGYTYPWPVHPTGVTRPGETFGRLSAAPGRDDATVDLSVLGLEHPVEDVVLLAGVRGPVVVDFHDDATRLVLDWDRTIVPNLMMWISDRALQEEPWNGRYRGLGLEPTVAAFDLPNEVSIGPNPLSADGVRTSLELYPGAPTIIRYSLEVSSLGA